MFACAPETRHRTARLHSQFERGRFDCTFMISLWRIAVCFDIILSVEITIQLVACLPEEAPLPQGWSRLAAPPHDRTCRMPAGERSPGFGTNRSDAVRMVIGRVPDQGSCWRTKTDWQDWQSNLQFKLAVHLAACVVFGRKANISLEMATSTNPQYSLDYSTTSSLDQVDGRQR